MHCIILRYKFFYSILFYTSLVINFCVLRLMASPHCMKLYQLVIDEHAPSTQGCHLSVHAGPARNQSSPLQVSDADLTNTSSRRAHKLAALQISCRGISGAGLC